MPYPILDPTGASTTAAPPSPPRGYRCATTPHPVAVLTPDQVKERAAQVLDDVVTLLTVPDE